MKIAENVYLLDSTKYSHVYLIRTEENILIDTGLPCLSKKILKEIQNMGISLESVKLILLTHHDVDHVGNARKLQEATHAKIWAPREDAPYITGGKKRPGIKRFIQAVIRPRIPFITGYYTTNQYFGDVQTIHAPGHTQGHTIFKYHDVLFTGDLFKVLNGRFQIMPKFMNWDHEQVMKSISLLKNIEFEWLCPSHGDPIQNGPVVKEFLSRY
jgi:glyoxylase-like metal-dependent hydrolase (beta-lactamase superfamily II)